MKWWERSKITDNGYLITHAFNWCIANRMLMIIWSTVNKHSSFQKKIISLDDMNHAYRILGRHIGHVLLGGWGNSQFQILHLCWRICLRRQWWCLTSRAQECASTCNWVSFGNLRSYIGSNRSWWRCPVRRTWNWSEWIGCSPEGLLTTDKIISWSISNGNFKSSS